LFAEAEQTAATQGEKAVICRCVDASDLLLRWVLRRRRYAEFPGPRHLVLTPPAGGLEGYLASFSSRYRNNIRRQIRILHDANVTISVELLTRELIASVVPLVDSLNRKYGLESVDGRAALETARRVFKENARAVVARVDGRPVGFVEMLVHRDSAWMLQAGFDYEFQGKLPLYFGIMFYGLMDFASSNQLFRIDYTFGTEEAKTSRGCTSRPTFREVLVLDPAVHDRMTAELARSADPSTSEVDA
jgi:predicted N-acyltransferase